MKSRKNIKNDGRSKTRLYSIYLNMKSRCYYSKNPRYKNYGERGITICEEWLNDYMIFKNWAIKNRYSDDLTIDRINVNANYEPSNCTWKTNSEQQNNKTNNHLVEYKGKTKTIKQWSNELNINYKTLEKRLKKWDIEKAIETPIGFIEKKIKTKKESTYKKIVATNLITGETKIYNLAYKAETEDGFKTNNILECCKGKRKTHHKHTFRFLEEGDYYNKSRS